MLRLEEGVFTVNGIKKERVVSNFWAWFVGERRKEERERGEGDIDGERETQKKRRFYLRVAL